jgi:hypothetical protein
MTMNRQDWGGQLMSALDETRQNTLTVFFRNDDAGWDDARLMRLLDLFAAHKLPIDLAVIPTELDAALASELLARRARSPLGLHQHGYQHLNHEPEGRKCEFGLSRDYDQQHRDIAEGLELLALQLGNAVDPIFTPPWNRCTQDTADALAAMGFCCLSRNLGADRLDTPGLRELPVAVDWQRRRDGNLTRHEEMPKALRLAAHKGWPLGVMLHHAVMDSGDLDALETLIGSLAGSRRVRFALMADLLSRPANLASSRGHG